VDLFDRSARCLATLGTEEHAFNRYAGVVDAETRGEVAAVLVSCDSAQGPCGSTLYVNGRLAFDMTEYPTDPIVSTYTKMTVDPEGNVLLVTDSARIGRDIEHRVRLVRYDGAVLKDTNLPPDRFSTVDVAADRQGRFVIAMAGQPAAGQARSTLQVVDHDLARLSFAPMREDIEINALWADSADTVIAVGQEGSPDPYGYVEALSIPGLAPVWPVHPKFPLGYAHAVDVGKDGLVWVVGDDPNDTVWLASYNPTTQVVIVAPPRPASADDPFATWSLTALDDGTVLFAHDSVYSYCP